MYRVGVKPGRLGDPDGDRRGGSVGNGGGERRRGAIDAGAQLGVIVEAGRLTVPARRIGVGAPDVGDTVIVAEYVSTGSERLLVLKSTNGTVHAYRGRELEESLYEVIASGDTTLDS